MNGPLPRPTPRTSTPFPAQMSARPGGGQPPRWCRPAASPSPATPPHSAQAGTPWRSSFRTRVHRPCRSGSTFSPSVARAWLAHARPFFAQFPNMRRPLCSHTGCRSPSTLHRALWLPAWTCHTGRSSILVVANTAPGSHNSAYAVFFDPAPTINGTSYAGPGASCADAYVCQPICVLRQRDRRPVHQVLYDAEGNNTPSASAPQVALARRPADGRVTACSQTSPDTHHPAKRRKYGGGTIRSTATRGSTTTRVRCNCRTRL